MSKVVFLAVNAKYVHSSLSVWLLAAAMAKNHGTKHDVKVVEATINQNIEEIACTVADFNPDIVGISAYIWNCGLLPPLLGLLRDKLPDALLVLGGPEAVFNEKYWLENGADHVLFGHCDFNIDPYTDEYFEALGDRISYIETSRGCPFSCAFCLSAKSSVEYLPLDIVKERIFKLSRSKTKTIKFVDRTFNCNAKRAYELFEYVIGLDTSCKFHFEVAADLFDEKALSLLRTAPAGRIQFEIGLQSFFEPALEAASRKTDLIKAEKNIKSLLEAQNCHIHADLIAGLPYETLDDFRISFNRAYQLGAHTLQLGFLKLLHGSRLKEQADGKVPTDGTWGILYDKNPPYEIQSSTWLSCDDIKILKSTENALQRTYNKGRFLTTIEYVLSVSKQTAFDFYHKLGSAFPNRKTQLEDYIYEIYEFCSRQAGIENNILCDKLLYDWLSMVKGKNLPVFLKERFLRKDKLREAMYEAAQSNLGRKPERNEYAVLSSGSGIFVDSKSVNPVTGLYEIFIVK
ncbi:MAG: DUF4080 domain-containing protein [Oscillospiraceae bacterium]|nr:DUF4080 domain-containing protein [Oscillospiraceae bacterium]